MVGTLPLRLLHLLLATLLLPSLTLAFTTYEAATIAHRQRLALEQPPKDVVVDVGIDIKISNPLLLSAHKALQALKDALYSDPNNFTQNWVGPDVCAYNGVFCVPSLQNASTSAVATLDMNGADVAGYLPREIGLMRDLAVLHLNSNRFCGIIPEEVRNMTELYEFDVSNNRFVGPFPTAVMGIPKLSYLDIRFNDFEGPIPPELFLKPYDAIFLNSNRFTSGIPETIGESKATVIVLANNNLGGCIPRSIGKAAATLDQFIFVNNSLTGCLPVEAGVLAGATVFDVSGNNLTGLIPPTLVGLSKVEQLDLSCNMFSGVVPRDVCQLPALANLSVSQNFFTGEAVECTALERNVVKSFNDEANCMGQPRPMQRSAGQNMWVAITTTSSIAATSCCVTATTTCGIPSTSCCISATSCFVTAATTALSTTTHAITAAATSLSTSTQTLTGDEEFYGEADVGHLTATIKILLRSLATVGEIPIEVDGKLEESLVHKLAVVVELGEAME
ncbi:hypothetical protein EJB05_30528, partial [Eragrostis curvula]